MSNIYRNVPGRLIENGIFVHGQERVRIGDMVEAIRFVQETIAKGARLRVANILIEPRGNQRGFEKRLEFDKYPDDDFNPKRFRKILAE